MTKDIPRSEMRTIIEGQLGRVAEIWNNFIWQYKFCSSRIKFNDDVKTNYFGEILSYFRDTLEIVYKETKNSNYSEKFTFTISFLQAIYIQQDLIQEMLEIFKTGIEKGVLKKDPTYYINRDLRNELVGHPIRKFEGNLISSTLFSYKTNEDEIQYIRYHKDNNFKFEIKTFRIVEIQERHFEFLEKYFDIILMKLKSILNDYVIELNKLEIVKNKHDFITVLKLVELYLEPLFISDYVYDKASLIKIYERRNEHIRYQYFIDRFYKDLRTALDEIRNSVKDIFEINEIDKTYIPSLSLPKINIVTVSSNDNYEVKKTRKISYHYEIEKIATKRNLMDFNFFGELLKAKCVDNELVLSELEHMKQNIHDEIEYYTSFRLICLALKEE